MDEIIKSTLSMRDVVEMYGFDVNRGGFIICPFHTEKTASLKIYSEPGKGFYCYGCGIGGSVIDFVMLLFNIPFRAALVRLNADFQLRLTTDRPSRPEIDRIRQERATKQRKKAEYEKEFNKIAAEFRRLHNQKLNSEPGSPEFVEACSWRYEYLSWWLDNNLSFEG